MMGMGALALLAIAAVVLLAFASYRTQALLMHRTERIASAAELLSSLKDAETGTRGYHPH